MKNRIEIHKKMLNQPGYWVEEVNGVLYDAIVRYMKDNNLKRKDLAKLFNISKSRVSQILNEGDINFSIEKIIEIALKINRFPDFKFEDKETYFEKHFDRKQIVSIAFKANQLADSSSLVSAETDESKVIPLPSNFKIKINDAIG